MKALVRLRCAFDKRAWPFVRRWFAFEVDTEFLRGFALGNEPRQDVLRDGNSATGGVKYVTITGVTGVQVRDCTFGPADFGPTGEE